MTKGMLLKEIEQAIQKAPAQVQEHLLADLPHILKISLTDLALLKLSEKSFGFWNNPDDWVYDGM